jgi:arsenate reductase-like glutaredoxin family protein
MSTITVYRKPTCATCRQVHAALKESGVDFDAVNPPPAPMLRRHDAIREG